MDIEKDVNLIDDKNEIDLIIENKIKNKKLIFTQWYKFGILKKGIPESKFDEIFYNFDKIYKIEKETLKLGDIGYEFFYKFSNNTEFSIGTIPKENVLLIVHLVEYKRSLEKRFKKFKK